jgi:hypothetical protein
MTRAPEEVVVTASAVQPIIGVTTPKQVGTSGALHYILAITANEDVVRPVTPPGNISETTDEIVRSWSAVGAVPSLFAVKGSASSPGQQPVVTLPSVNLRATMAIKRCSSSHLVVAWPCPDETPVKRGDHIITATCNQAEELHVDATPTKHVGVSRSKSALNALKSVSAESSRRTAGAKVYSHSRAGIVVMGTDIIPGADLVVVYEHIAVRPAPQVLLQIVGSGVKVILSSGTAQAVFVGTSIDAVVPTCTANEVVARETTHDIVTTTGRDHIVASRAFQPVMAGGAGNRCLMPPTMATVSNGFLFGSSSTRRTEGHQGKRAGHRQNESPHCHLQPVSPGHLPPYASRPRTRISHGVLDTMAEEPLHNEIEECSYETRA